MSKNESRYGSKVFETINWIAHRIPPYLLRTISLPIDYNSKTRDAFANESARMINMAFAYLNNNKLFGDYAEFGVYTGKTFIEAFRAGEAIGRPDMNYWAFDSFQGLPEVKNQDEGGPFYTGEFSFSKREFTQNLIRYKVDLRRVEMIEGYYDQTLELTSSVSKLPKSVAIAWVDCDLYESTVPVLNYLGNVLVDGAVIIFDDWFCFNGRRDRGEQLACREWLDRNPTFQLTEYQKYHWGGNSFIFNRID